MNFHATKITSNDVNFVSNYAYAEPNDICFVINGVLCVCNTQNGVNNIVIEKLLTSKALAGPIALYFVYLLYKDYNIEYISVKQDRKWKLLKRYKSFMNEGGISYIKISENIDQIIKELKI